MEIFFNFFFQASTFYRKSFGGPEKQSTDLELLWLKPKHLFPAPHPLLCTYRAAPEAPAPHASNSWMPKTKMGETTRL